MIQDEQYILFRTCLMRLVEFSIILGLKSRGFLSGALFWTLEFLLLYLVKTVLLV